MKRKTRKRSRTSRKPAALASLISLGLIGAIIALFGCASSVPQTARTTSPLVYVTASRAEAVIRETTVAAAAFENLTFEDNQAQAADYVIVINLKIRGGHSGWNTSGTSNGCQLVEVTLTAQVAGSNRTVLRTYTATNTIRPGLFRTDCRPSDELARAQAISRLVRKVYREIRRDRVVAVS